MGNFECGMREWGADTVCQRSRMLECPAGRVFEESDAVEQRIYTPEEDLDSL
jgi:hypothetical protein